MAALPNSEGLLFFLHIPKAAGSTLAHIIRRQYPADRILDSYPTTFRAKTQGKNALESARWRYNYFASLPEAKKRQVRAFMGHEGFGFHRVFPKPVTHITMLRHPIDRVLSYYYYIHRSQRNRMYKTVVSGQLSLEEFVTSGISNEVDNSQTKFLAGLETPYLLPGKYDEEILEVAKQNLKEHFCVVGLTEKFDESLIMMRRALDWRMPYYVPANVTRKRPHHQEIAPEVLAQIKEANRLDLDLYSFAQNMLEAQIREQGTAFQKELKIFRSLNRIYALGQMSLSTVYRGVRTLPQFLNERKGRK